MFSRAARRPADILVLHDTDSKNLHSFVKNCVVGCKLMTGCCSVAYTVDFDGSVRQHHDLNRRGIHAGSHINPRSYGIEVVSQYHPQRGRPIGNQRVVPAGWFPGGRAIMPSPRQLEHTFSLAEKLVKRGKIPWAFPGVQNGYYIWGPIYDGVRDVPSGIYAHAQLTHKRGDGHYPTVYVYLRRRGYTPKQAYFLTVQQGAQAHNGRSRLPG